MSKASLTGESAWTYVKQNQAVSGGHLRRMKLIVTCTQIRVNVTLIVGRIASPGLPFALVSGYIFMHFNKNLSYQRHIDLDTLDSLSILQNRQGT